MVDSEVRARVGSRTDKTRAFFAGLPRDGGRKVLSSY